MHSTGGRGITENFLGLDSANDGSGHMYTLASDVKVQLDDRLARARVRHGDLGALAAGRRDGRDQEPRPPAVPQVGRRAELLMLPKLARRARYDRVILDDYDRENSFRVLSPKIGFPLDNWGELFVQYSHYWYGDKIQLRAGQVPLETMPDSDVFKLQAQVGLVATTPTAKRSAICDTIKSLNARVSTLTWLLLGSAACGFAPHTTSDVPRAMVMLPPAQLRCARSDRRRRTDADRRGASSRVLRCDGHAARLRVIGSRTTSSTIHRITTTAAGTGEYANGKAGKAVVIGTTNGIDIADSASFDVTDLTIEAWISPVGDSHGHEPRRHPRLTTASMGSSCTRMATWSARPAATITAQANVQANHWTHVACTHANNTISIYADGVLITSGAATAGADGAPRTASRSAATTPRTAAARSMACFDQLRLFGGRGRTAQGRSGQGRRQGPTAEAHSEGGDVSDLRLAKRLSRSGKRFIA